jgi:hypothetical protein
MANTTLSLDQLNKLFQGLTISMLGITFADDNDKTPYYKVRVAWPTGGAPSWKIAEDICFLQIMEVDSQYNRQRDVILGTKDTDNANGSTSYTRVMQVNFILYGPNSFQNAQTIRDQMFFVENLFTLAKNNVYPIPDISAPRRAPELYEGQWWGRTDLSITFNELIIVEQTIPYLKSADITIEDSERIEKEIEITNS